MLLSEVCCLRWIFKDARCSNSDLLLSRDAVFNGCMYLLNVVTAKSCFHRSAIVNVYLYCRSEAGHPVRGRLPSPRADAWHDNSTGILFPATNSDATDFYSIVCTEHLSQNTITHRFCFVVTHLTGRLIAGVIWNEVRLSTKSFTQSNDVLCILRLIHIAVVISYRKPTHC